MNGRVYDPIVGRFASPDPYVQFPESTQGLNRYTYVNNSPLSYTDPSGFFSFGDLFKALINPAILVNEYIIENPRESLAIGLMVVPGGQILGVQSALAGFAVATAQGFAAGMVAGRGDLRAGLMGAATAGAFYGVGSAFQGMKGGAEGSFWGTGLTRGEFAGKVIVHGAVGGAASDWYGGSFSDGFLGAAAGQAFGAVAMKNVTDRALRVGTAALVGGTAAHIGGGKFANGAITAAFGQAFNDAEHHNPAEAIRDQALQDGHLSLSEANAIWRANTDPNFELTVDASQLSVRQLGDFGGPNNTAPGRVQGINDYLVHGQVRLQQQKNGTISILPGTYDFRPHNVSNYSSAWRGYTRNTATYGGFYTASQAGLSVGTDYLINYKGQPDVFR